MNCPACRSETPAGARFCPACAATLPQESPGTPAPEVPSYHRTDAIAPPAPPTPPTLPAGTPTSPARPSATGQIVFAAINMVCCGGSVFGIAALVLAILATTDKAYEDAKGKLRTARILNIIGICISGAFAVLYILYMLFVVLIMLIPFSFGSPDIVTGPTSFVVH